MVIWDAAYQPAPHAKMATSHIFKVVFVNQGKVYEIYARKVSHGSLFGFIEVEELVFGERSAVVVDPSEEKVKAEFEGVKRTYLPLHSVLRVDEVRTAGRQQGEHVRRLERHAVSDADVYARGQEIAATAAARGASRLSSEPSSSIIRARSRSTIRAGCGSIGSKMLILPGAPALSDFRINQTSCRRTLARSRGRIAHRALRPLRADASRRSTPTSGASSTRC